MYKCFRKDHPAAVLVRTDFLKDMLGFQQHSNLIYSLDWGRDDHQDMKVLLRSMQCWQPAGPALVDHRTEHPW